MVFSFVKFPYTSAQALVCSVADFTHPAQCHLQSNTLQVKGLPDLCMQKCSPHQHRDCQSLQEVTLGMYDFEVAKCSQRHRCYQENLPKASLGLNCEIFLRCMEGVEVPGLRFPLQGCECQPEGTWHLPAQQGHFPRPDNSLSEL